MGLVIPKKCLGKFTRKEQEVVLRSLLTRINLTVLRSRTVYIRVRGFGKIFTHGNLKNTKTNYSKKRNRELWKKEKLKKDFSKKKLLY